MYLISLTGGRPRPCTCPHKHTAILCFIANLLGRGQKTVLFLCLVAKRSVSPARDQKESEYYTLNVTVRIAVSVFKLSSDSRGGGGGCHIFTPF